MNSSRKQQVLFVCMGNICRSPAGEGVLQELVNQHQLTDQIVIDSAGTTGYHVGDPADARMRKAASNRQISLTSRARQVEKKDLQNFDMVIAMDQDNLNYLKKLDSNPKATVCLFSEFLDDNWPSDVPDPYYGGDEGFEFVLDMLQAGCPTIINALLAAPE